MTPRRIRSMPPLPVPATPFSTPNTSPARERLPGGNGPPGAEEAQRLLPRRQTRTPLSEDIPLRRASLPAPSSNGSAHQTELQPLRLPVSSSEITEEPVVPRTPPTARREAAVTNSKPSLAKSKQRIEAQLGAYPLTFASAAQEAEYRAHRTKYVDWAAPIDLARIETFGKTYERGSADIHNSLWDTSLAVSFETMKGSITSALRSAVRNGIVAGLGTTGEELGLHNIDQWLIGGAMGAFITILVEQLMIGAAEVRAKVNNLAQIKPVDAKVLVPTPCEVGMKMVAGVAQFTQRTPEELKVYKDNANSARGWAQHAQDIRGGKALWTAWFPGVTSSAFQAARRHFLPEYVFTHLWPTIGTSYVASSLGGGASALAFSTAKVRATTKIDDLMGGTRHVPIYTVDLLHPAAEPLRLFQAKGVQKLLKGAGETVLETVYRAGYSLNMFRPAERVHQYVSLGATMFVGALASYTSGGLPWYGASIFRLDANKQPQLTPLPSEKLNSNVFTFQQATGALADKGVWDAFRATYVKGNFDLSKTIEKSRNVAARNYVNTAKQAYVKANDLIREAGDVELDIGHFLNEPLPTTNNLADAIQALNFNQLSVAQRSMARSPWAMSLINTLALDDTPALQVTAQLHKALNALKQKQSLDKWRDGDAGKPHTA